MSINVLYGLPAIGNGHLARARHIIPLLQKYAHVDVLTCGDAAQIQLPCPVTYAKKGLSLHYNDTGWVSIPQTLMETNMFRVMHDIATIPVQKYDLVISDFEPLSAWAAKFRNIPCVHIWHQAAFLSPKTPRPDSKHHFFELFFSDTYIPHQRAIGFHFQTYDTFIHTPVIRDEIRQQKVSNKGHISVYLQTYNDKMLIEHFEKFPQQKFEIFSRFTKTTVQHGNTTLYPITNNGFVESLASSAGLITGGGFEGPAEAIFLGKKLLCIPQTWQYEQLCNAAALSHMWIMTLPKIDNDFTTALHTWFEEYKPLHIDYADNTEKIITDLLN